MRLICAAGEVVTAVMPWSEVMMHVRMADKPMRCYVTVGSWPMVQLVNDADRPVTLAVTLGEAGFRRLGDGGFTYEAEAE